MLPLNPIFKAFCYAIGLFISTLSWALPGDREQPINIKANTAEQSVNNDLETTVYTGQVVMTQGSMLIEGDKVTIYSKNNAVTKVIAIGKPAHFKQQSALEEEPVKAYALEIDYNLTREIIVLQNEASLYQGQDEIRGKRIDYNITTEQVKATSASDGPVEMVLQPRSNQDKSADQDKRSEQEITP